MNGLKLATKSTDDSSHEPTYNPFDQICLAYGVKVMQKNPTTGQVEPKASMAFWLIFAAVITIVMLTYFVADSGGYIRGKERGITEEKTQQIQEDLKDLKDKQSESDRIEKNIRLAQELTDQSSNSNRSK